MKEFDVQRWNRKKQFEFFKEYKDPFFNVTATIDVTNLYQFCKKYKLSFSLACIYIAINSINEIPEFKLRFKDKKVVTFDKVTIRSTVLNENNTFSFCDFELKPSIFEFIKEGNKVIENHRKGVKFDPQENEVGIVHCSTLPWISFTSFKHARNGDERTKGIPKIVFGKWYEENKIKKIPFSVEVHHALMDGLHVGILYEKMQNCVNSLV